MGGVYTDNVSEEELSAYMEGIAESVPKDAPESDFADPPKGLYVGDAKHAGLAVQAVTSGFRGNKAKSRSKPGVKSKVASAVRKFYKGAERDYYLSWLRTGRKPDKKPASEMQGLTEIAIMTPRFTTDDEARFPDVPFTPGVDIARLTMNDPKPLYVIRPLAIEGGVSDNNLKYTDEMLSEIYQQVYDKRPPGRLGHVAEANRSWEVPPDSCLWVGVLDDPGTIFGKRTIFGKAYIYPTMPLHEMVEKRSAAGTPLSNSIWGMADLIDNSDGTVSSQATDIESIDFVSPERAALKALGGDFVVTSEMTEEEAMAEEHSDAAADLELFKKAVASIKPEAIHEALHEAGQAHEIATAHVRMHEAGGTCAGGSMHEMFTREGRAKMCETHLREEATPEETYKMLSDTHRKHVAECYTKENKTLAEETRPNDGDADDAKSKSAIGEMSGKLTEMASRMAEMEKQIKAYQRADFERALDSAVETYFDVQVRTDSGKAVLSNLKARVRKDSLIEMAGMDGGQTEANIKAACDKAWTENKPLVEMAYAGLQGPNVVIAPPRDGGNRKDFRTGIDQSTGFFSPEFMKTAKAASAGAPRRKGGK